MRTTTLLLYIFLTSATPAIAHDLLAQVIGVTDGDTITVIDSNNREMEVRLFGIDAPETTCHAKHNVQMDSICIEKAQPFAKASKLNLSNIVSSKLVSIDFKGESYGRVVGLVNIGKINVCLQQIEDGFAWNYDYYTKKLPIGEVILYRQAELDARQNHKGMWVSDQNISPWQYRKLNPYVH